MDRPVGLLVFALLVFSAFGVGLSMAADGEGSSVGRSDVHVPPNGTNQTPNRLDVGQNPVSGFATPAPELSTAVSMGDRQLRATFASYRTVEEYELANTSGTRENVIREALDRIDARIDGLRRFEASSIRAYSQGRIDTRELTRRLATIDTQAKVFRRSLAALKQVHNFGFELDTRLTGIRGELSAFETRTRGRIGDAFLGVGPSVRVHVVGARTGVAVERVGTRRYYRNAVRTDHYDASDPTEAELGGVLAHLKSVYPLIQSESSISQTEIGSRLWEFTYRYRIGTTTGTTTVYLGYRTGKIYRESHRLDLATLPTETVANRTKGGVRLLVNRTDQGNPYEVRVVDARTGTPISASVSVAGRPVGTTTDGPVWALGPRGQFNVTADTGRKRLRVSIDGTVSRTNSTANRSVASRPRREPSATDP